MATQQVLPQACNRRNLCISLFSSLLLVPFGKPAYSIVGGQVEKPEHFSRSGDDEFDGALIAELKRICHILEVNPGFRYIDGMNAYATSDTIWPGTKGTVMLGLPLMRKLMEDADGGPGVAGVCAHECAHIFQFQRSLVDILKSPGDERVMFVELHADFIAGYYMGRRKEFVADQIQKFSAVTFGFGDYVYTDVTHHGTPAQRAAAVEQGYRLAHDGKSIAKAAELGLSYVRWVGTQ